MAADVDARARFPQEGVESLRESGLLAAAAPVHLGGLELDLAEMTSVAERLAHGCAATAMVWAMHQTQLACLVRHHPDAPITEQAVREQWLIASVTSEAGVGGDLRRSWTSLSEADGDGELLTLRKQAPTVSYGEHAQAYLVTARRAPDAPEGGQAAVLVRRDQVRLTRTGEWNTLGMRGTCSPPFEMDMTFGRSQVLPVPFGDVAARTMVPLSHVLWTGVWTGLAAEAVRRAAALCRARGSSDNPSLALAHTKLAGLRGQLAAAVETARSLLTGERSPAMASTVELNALKAGASETSVDIARLALETCGMAGFAESGPYSVARIVRDLHSAPLMIANRRLLSTNAAMLTALRGDR
ncbi:hypothetical protein N566_04795 [Streptomycetaceae bacterium MP113-05]|nr:hypothetical protein N566_04795 [Streptomycetaceae bacterium MP113-05]